MVDTNSLEGGLLEANRRSQLSLQEWGLEEGGRRSDLLPERCILIRALLWSAGNLGAGVAGVLTSRVCSHLRGIKKVPSSDKFGVQHFKFLAESFVRLHAGWLGCFPGQNVRDILARTTGSLKVLERA